MDKVGYKTTHNIIDSSTQLYLCQKNTQLYLIMKKRTLIMKKWNINSTTIIYIVNQKLSYDHNHVILCFGKITPVSML